MSDLTPEEIEERKAATKARVEAAREWHRQHPKKEKVKTWGEGKGHVKRVVFTR